MSADPDHVGAAAAAFAEEQQSIDDLDDAIRTLAGELNAETYRMLMLVREFDERFGWQKWGLRNCAEWLAWRCDLSLSAAHEKVRTANALARCRQSPPRSRKDACRTRKCARSHVSSSITTRRLCSSTRCA
jgi:hypothetical protein